MGGMTKSERVAFGASSGASFALLFSFVARLLWMRFKGGRLPLNEDLFVFGCIDVGIAVGAWIEWRRIVRADS